MLLEKSKDSTAKQLDGAKPHAFPWSGSDDAIVRILYIPNLERGITRASKGRNEVVAL